MCDHSSFLHANIDFQRFISTVMKFVYLKVIRAIQSLMVSISFYFSNMSGWLFVLNIWCLEVTKEVWQYVRVCVCTRKHGHFIWGAILVL